MKEGPGGPGAGSWRPKGAGRAGRGGRAGEGEGLHSSEREMSETSFFFFFFFSFVTLCYPVPSHPLRARGARTAFHPLTHPASALRSSCEPRHACRCVASEALAHRRGIREKEVFTWRPRGQSFRRPPARPGPAPISRARHCVFSPGSMPDRLRMRTGHRRPPGGREKAARKERARAPEERKRLAEQMGEQAGPRPDSAHARPWAWGLVHGGLRAGGLEAGQSRRRACGGDRLGRQLSLGRR